MKLRRSCLLIILTFMTACASLPQGRAPWGQHTTLMPGWQRLKQVSVDAAKDPQVWVPVLGAAVFVAADWDDNVSDWAVDHHPLSDDKDDAGDLSDDLRDLTTLAYLGSALTMPSGELYNKGKAIGVGILAIGLNDGITDGIKSATGRERPDERSDNSFPSKHASQASVRATLTARNLDYVDMNPDLRMVLKGSVYTLAGLTAWERVEAERHYPSDVLFGYALGRFIGLVVNDAFITPMSQGKASVFITPEQNGFVMQLRANF